MQHTLSPDLCMCVCSLFTPTDLFVQIGLVATILLLPCIPILHVLHIERFILPNRTTLLALTLNGLIGSVLSNMLLAARNAARLAPLVATVGLSLSIPLAIATDTVRGRSAQFF